MVANTIAAMGVNVAHVSVDTVPPRDCAVDNNSRPCRSAAMVLWDGQGALSGFGGAVELTILWYPANTDAKPAELGCGFPTSRRIALTADTLDRTVLGPSGRPATRWLSISEHIHISM